MHSCFLRGMIRMHMESFSHPLKCIQSIHQLVHSDPMKETFRLNLLLFDAERDQLCFISCQSGVLWHIAKTSETVKTLTTPNGALGADPHAVFLETIDNWLPGDTIIFSSGEETNSEWIEEVRMLGPQAQATKALYHLYEKKPTPKRACIALSMRRMF
jgi:hypothetical protein